ncbi:MAG: ATP-binding protein [Motiliproteus sp.]
MDEDLSELDELVNELLSYARLERLGVELERTSHNLSQWLTEQRPLLARNCRKPLTLQLSEPLQLKFDAPLLIRALNNLVRNADSYAQERIEIRLYRDTNAAVICVDDDGIGIPESERERVLEPFERVDNARSRKSGGHGLGLSIVREIIQQHQGRLLISESPLGGTRIAICLPIDD